MGTAVLNFINKVNGVILNPLIKLVFAIALLYFFFGIFQFIRSETSDSNRKKGQQKILYGLVGMFIMVSAYGIIHFILQTFGIPANPGTQYLGI